MHVGQFRWMDGWMNSSSSSSLVDWPLLGGWCVSEIDIMLCRRIRQERFYMG